MTEKTIIKTCICFLDAAVLYVKTADPSFNYNIKCRSMYPRKKIFCLQNRMSIHYGEKRESSIDTFVSICVKRAKFQFALKASLGGLDNVRCLFVKNNVFVPDELNYFGEMTDNGCKETADFRRRPSVNSCFTESILDFNKFCSSC